ncbi:DUF6056 family protein [Kurthia senegalensis]|uniref:DUF6056 family protein n=1 Tax=Kurthia senegalensis TaxID=1033740 RepID=UPI000287F089|nr:DUF6056 family protein [Kurthia senegalensis]
MKYADKIEKNGRYFFYGLIIVYFGWLTWNTPLTGDDWTWQSSLGMDRLHTFFANYNGRYVSNILEIILVRSEWLRIVFHAFVTFGLLYFMTKVTTKKPTKSVFLLAFILVFSMSTKIFAQTFGWTAGFVNYIVSIVLILVYLTIVKRVFTQNEPTYHKWTVYGMVALGFFSQLIVEHGTLFSVYTAILVVIVTKYKLKKVYKEHVAYLIASIAGAICMFSNGAYLNVLLGKDDYRNLLDQSFTEKVVDIYTNRMSGYVFESNMWIILFISVAAILVWSHMKPKTVLLQVIQIVSIFYFYAYGIVVTLSSVPSMHKIFAEHTYTMSILSLVYLIILCLVPLAIADRRTQAYSWYLLSGVILMSLPFMFISPYGPRCAFASVIFLILFGMKLLDYYRHTTSFNFEKLFVPLTMLTLVVGVQLGVPIAENGHVDRARLEKIATDLEAHPNRKTLRVERIPNPQYHWMPNPSEKVFMTQFFKQNHDIDEDVTIKIVRKIN